MKGAAAILIAAVIVGAVIAFQLGIISLPRAGQSTPTESYTTEIKSVDDGGHADSVLVSTHSAQLGGTEAEFAAEVTVDIVLQITEASGSTIARNHLFTLTVDVPQYTSSGGNTFTLVKYDTSASPCPMIAYTVAGSGSISVGSDCSVRGVLGTGESMGLTLSLTMNNAYFGGDEPTSSVFVIHVTNADVPSDTVEWLVHS